MTEIIAQLYLAQQADLLSLSLINLLDMIKDGEIDLVLDQAKKSIKQKALFIQRIIESVESPELRAALEGELNKELSDPKSDLHFFREKYLEEVLHHLQSDAEKLVVVKLVLAIEFKEKELREMAALLTEKLGSQVVLAITVDNSQVGGVIIQSGNYISDYTIKSRLEQFRSHWQKAVVER